MKFYRPQEYYSKSRWKGTQALDGGGALINQGIHGLDLLLHLVGEEVASVSAKTAVRAHEGIEVEDTCVAILTFKSGALGVVQACTSITPDTQQRLELHGTKGTIILEGTEDVWIKYWETERDGRRRLLTPGSKCTTPEVMTDRNSIYFFIHLTTLLFSMSFQSQSSGAST